MVDCLSKICNVLFVIVALTRSRSEGSLPEASNNHSGSGSKKGSGGNLSQNSSQSLNDLDMKGAEGRFYIKYDILYYELMMLLFRR